MIPPHIGRPFETLDFETTMRTQFTSLTPALKGRVFLPAISIALSLLIGSNAFAADKPKKEGSFGGGKSSGAFLTKDQLRACFAQQDRMKEQGTDLAKEQAEIAAMKADINKTGDALKAQLDTVDRTNTEAVAAYNDQAQARDKQIDTYQTRVTAFNERVQSASTDRESFTKDCESKRYFEEDEIAIKKPK
jgi:hypothetical protein